MYNTINIYQELNEREKYILDKLEIREINEIVHNKRKIVEFKEVEKIRNQANQRIRESINFKPVTIPIMEFGSTEQRKFFKQILEYKPAV